MKKILLGSIVTIGLICVAIFNFNYRQSFNKNNYSKDEYLALASSDAISKITLKKEIVDAKSYYTAGDTINYKITITNNNTEAVKVKLDDNYSNLERTQKNLVLKSAKCNERQVTIKNNKMDLSVIDLAASATYTCNVEATANKDYPEGKVVSIAKVSIADTDYYKEERITYTVRDSILDIQVNKPQRYYYYWKEPVVYEVQIKNISSEKASGKVEVKLNPHKNPRFKEPYSNYIEYSKSGASKNLVSNEIVSYSCKAPDGGVCVSDQEQIVTFTIAGVNPNETINLNVKFYYNKSDFLALPFQSTINEYDSDTLLKQTFKSYSIVVTNNANDVKTSMTPIDSDGNIVDDFNSLDFKDGKAKLYLNFDYDRIDSSYGLSKNTTLNYAALKLPSNVEHLESQSPAYTNCATKELISAKDDNSLYNIKTGCSLLSTSTKANVKVPITVTTRLLNKHVCLDAFNSYKDSGAIYLANRYCIGSKSFNVTGVSATQENNVINIGISAKNNRNLSNGRGENLTLTYNYSSGLEIDESSLSNATIDKTNRIITWNIPLIRSDEVVTINVKAKNISGLKTISASGAIEGVNYSFNSAIVDSGRTYLKGDWNLNNEVNVSDVIYARKYIARIGNLALPPAEVYDLNNDGQPSISDVVLLRKYIAENS